MTDIKQIAQSYIDEGWAVVPLVKGEKRANTSWQKTTYSADAFKKDDGIAGKCGEASGWRVDVDLDSKEAVEAAKMLLPHTGLVHGRPGKPDSHYWFICEGIKTTQFSDIAKGGMLVEIRSSGGYTALPPSGHPSGDVLAWVSQRKPMKIAPEVLYDCVREVAICALLVRHWPGSGQTHAAVGPLTGFLVAGGLAPDAVQRVIVAAATIAKSDVRDVTNYVAATLGKFAAGDKVTGGPKLAQAIGEDVVTRMRAWLKLADIDAIEEMNAKHFWVRLGKDDVIGREDDPSGVVFQKPRSLYTEYANRQIVMGTDEKGKPKMLPLFEAWLKHPARRTYERVVFCPPPKQPGARDYNLWKGFSVEPREGDCSKFLAHVRGIICGAHDEHYEYLLNLLALTIQEPGTPSEVAVVLRGEPGTGKGTFIRALMDIFGRAHSVQLDKVDHLAGHFNAIISGKIIVFADEAFFAGDKREIGTLKRIITEPTLTIVRKGIDATQEDNHMHLFMATNEEWSIPAQLKERRFLALEVSSARIGDYAYFGELREEMRNGGAAAFLDMMLKRPIDRDLLRKVPHTKELRNQQAMSLPHELEWWQDCLWEGRVPGAQWNDWAPVSALYDVYFTWATAHHYRLLSKIEFGRRMVTYMSADESKARKIKGEVIRCLFLRTLDDARKFFDAKLASPTSWPDVRGAIQGTL